MRLVAYEGLTRSPTPIFNEKVLAGLGREVQSTGLLAADAVEKALAALRRFRTLCDRMEVAQLWVIATAACRDAKNGKAFVAEAETHLRHQGRDHLRQARGRAERARRRVAASTGPTASSATSAAARWSSPRSMGTGSRPASTLPLGGLALQDITSKSIKKAEKIVRKALQDAKLLKAGEAAPSTPSAAPGARSRGCTCGRPAIRCM